MKTVDIRSTEPVKRSRSIEQLVAGRPTSDGAGVRLTRVLTQAQQRRLDPFLMLDAFGSENPDDYIAGFPDHPHRGFETVTYMIAGRMRHRDNHGHEGLLGNGGMQWMTAGRGIVHSEIPEQQEGVMEGFQLWLNLPSNEKMCVPWYRDFAAEDLPRFSLDGAFDVTVIAGESHGVTGAVTREGTAPLFLDVHMQPGATFSQQLPAGHNAFIYVYRGAVASAGGVIPVQRLAVLGNEPDADGVSIDSPEEARFLLIAGKPLNEPIVQYGPFVMNNDQEIYQAIADFREARFG